jgi:hypothetical protein
MKMAVHHMTIHIIQHCFSIWCPIYWLLLQYGTVQSIPCTADISWSIVHPHLSSNHSWPIHQCSLVAEEATSSKAGRWWQTSLNLVDVICRHTMQGFLTCCKILWHRANGFTSPLKEGVLQIFITLTIHRPQPGLNLWNLSRMASTLTIMPPRTMMTNVKINVYNTILYM